MQKKKNVKKQSALSQKTELKKAEISERKKNTALIVILLLTLIAFLPVLKADFVNWDDQEYVYENPLITSFDNIKELIMTPVQGNLHPLTMLSLAVNYSISQYHAWSYHLFNLILHLANTFLVFLFVKKLSKDNIIISLTTALLFGLHPMHVESVAWVTERKDVLYAFFFLLGLISYVKYIDSNSKGAYFLCMLWCILSLASKPAAVVFPLALFCIDLLRKQKITLKLIALKIPFFIFAAILGYLTLQNQSNIGATEGQLFVSPINRFFFGFYGFFMYFVKFIFPFNLAPFYPFPDLDKPLPFLYYLSPLFFIGIFILSIRLFKKSPVPAFGFSFYLVNLILVLQFFIVGSSIISDRYTYVSYIGLFYIAGWLLDSWQRQNFSKAIIYVYGLAFILTIVTYNQSSAWKNSATLWDHAIKVNPSFRAFNNRALVFHKEGNNERALQYYTEAIKLNPRNAELYCNRGNIFSEKRNFEAALSDYNAALKIIPDYKAALENRGTLYGATGKFELSIADLSKVLAVDPKSKSAYANRGTAYLDFGKYDEAISDYNKYLELVPNDVDIMNSIGVCYQRQKKYEEALQIFNRMISINPKPVFFLNRSYAWRGLGNMDEARKDALRARQGGILLPPMYAQMLGI